MKLGSVNLTEGIKRIRRQLGMARLWQCAFLMGLVICIITSAAVFGFRWSTSTIGLIVVIVGILNALLAPPGTPQGNWFISKVKEALNVNWLLKLATVAFWVTSLGIGIYGGMNLVHEARKFTISGKVLTAAGDPARNAWVYLTIGGHQQQSITTGGTFRFEKVDPTSNQGSLDAEWENPRTKEFLKSVTHSIDLSLSGSKDLEIKLPPGNPPFKVTYYWLEGYAIDFLIRYRQADKKFERVLGSQPIVLKNGTYAELEYLMKNFSEPATADEVYAGIPGEDPSATAEKIKGKKVLAGVWRGDQPFQALGESRFRSLFLNDPTCNLLPVFSERVTKKKQFPYELYFWRFATIEDFEFVLQGDRLKKQNPTLDFYRYITKDSFPQDFSVLYCSYSYDQEMCPEEDANTYLLPRYLKLLVIAIENISEEPINIDSFLVRENAPKRLRYTHDDETAIAGVTAERRNYFAQRVLKKGQVLLLPLEIALSHDAGNDEGRFFDVTDFIDYFDSSKESNKAQEWLMKNGKNAVIGRQPFHLQATTLLRLLEKAPQDPALDKDYLFGPSIEVESLSIGNVDYPVRQYDPKVIFFQYAGYTGGSCPYVYTFSSTTNNWQKEGQILGGMNTRAKEGVYKKILTHFDGRLLLREEDPEISYIDWLNVRVTTGDGKVYKLNPRDRRLRYQDGSYLILKQGDQIQIQFDGPEHARIVDAVLMAKGYYLRLARK